MISYYGLLSMIRENNIPVRIKLHLTRSHPVIYKAEYEDGEFNYYYIENEEDKDQDYHFFLSDCLVESVMFINNIEILNQEE